MCIDYKGESTVCLGERSQPQTQEGAEGGGGGGGAREKDQQGNEKKTHG